MKIIHFGGGQKTKPIQSQTKPILFSSQMLWGLKGLFEKTNPILKEQNELKYLYERVL